MINDLKMLEIALKTNTTSPVVNALTAISSVFSNSRYDDLSIRLYKYIANLVDKGHTIIDLKFEDLGNTLGVSKEKSRHHLMELVNYQVLTPFYSTKKKGKALLAKSYMINPIIANIKDNVNYNIYYQSNSLPSSYIDLDPGINNTIDCSRKLENKYGVFANILTDIAYLHGSFQNKLSFTKEKMLLVCQHIISTINHQKENQYAYSYEMILGRPNHNPMIENISYAVLSNVFKCLIKASILIKEQGVYRLNDLYYQHIETNRFRLCLN